MWITLKNRIAAADQLRMFRSLVLPAIVALWGFSIVLRALAGDGSSGSGAYGTGQDLATMTGVVMAVLGTVYVVRALRARA